MIDASKYVNSQPAMKMAAAAAVPAPEPISLERAKQHLRVVYDDEDEYISALIVAAREMAEQRLNRTLVRRIRRVAFDRMEVFYRLPKPPFVGLVSVNYSVPGGVTPVDAIAYGLDEISTPARIVPISGWPSLNEAGSTVIVEYEAGYAEGEVPAPIIQWMLLVIGSLYENRETMTAGVTVSSIPEEFTSWLLQPYMVYE